MMILAERRKMDLQDFIYVSFYLKVSWWNNIGNVRYFEIPGTI